MGVGTWDARSQPWEDLGRRMHWWNRRIPSGLGAGAGCVGGWGMEKGEEKISLCDQSQVSVNLCLFFSPLFERRCSKIQRIR